VTRIFVAPSKLELRIAAAAALAGFAAMFGVSLLVSDPSEPGAIVFMPPVALVGLEFGVIGGILGAGVGTSLWWCAETIRGDAPGIGAAGARVAVFLVVAILIGWLASRMRGSEASARRLFETANEGIWIVGIDGRTSFVNERMAEIVGRGPGELVGRRPPDGLFAPPPDSSQPYDVELARRDGTSASTLVNSSQITDHRGRPEGVLAMVTDITDRKRAQAMLEDAQRMAHIGSWTWRVDHDSVAWSDELARIHGLDGDPGETKLADFLALVADEDRERVRSAIEHTLRLRRPFELTYRIVRPDGTRRVLEASGAVDAGDPEHALRLTGVGHDVTERLAAEEALAGARMARKQAAELNDNVVQGLVLAKYALARDDRTAAARMIDGTLGQARRMIADLIGRQDVQPGDLRREHAAGVE
jgi:PAS domain S-box-containing protein